jgi:FixJ family two-component response regulator
VNQSREVQEQANSAKQEGSASREMGHRSETGATDSAKSLELLKHRVLIVDDEASVLTSLRRLLRREPYELVTADSGEEALRLLEEHAATVVISDQRMPGMTGIELFQEVQNRWPDTIRVILSGYSAVQTIIEAINEGEVYKFLSKPWNDEELRSNIRRALDQYDLQAENRRMSRQIAEQNERLKKLNAELDQRAADATAGLSSIQDLHDAIAVGVITFDESELIVAANRLGSQMLSAGAELFGMPASEVLPDEVYQAFFPESSPSEPRAEARGSLEHGGRKLQWRLEPVGGDDNARGRVATIWEDVQ